MLRKQASLFEKIHGYTWFLNIDNAENPIAWLKKLNNDPKHQLNTADVDLVKQHLPEGDF